MKKMIALMGIGLMMGVSFAGAAASPITVTTPLNIIVSKVCQSELSPATRNLTYNAIDGLQGDTSAPNYKLRCTVNTTLAVTNSVVVAGMNVGQYLVATSSNDVVTQSSGNSGEVHTANLTLTAPLGYWDVPAATYTGTVTTNIAFY
ncbi:hypothetical protein GCM10022631_19570 [Deinococcus rubellus]|uniref:Spore coat protein U domain-containing protein n=1 Tax=Deinococcus rubellus TaxID=1889240 RepID=A0ABY5YGA6_9DEIO|nr:hypothetical protein [Deinococcus rubellus]UWX63751.1 hypothetical protein N0D28_13605 [Deinococcus rubellus]